MEKILQILAVFVILMLVITRFIRGREPRYRPYDYLLRRKPPLPPEVEQRLVAAVFAPGNGRYPVNMTADAFLFDEVNRLLFCYSAEGALTIFKEQTAERYKEMQSLAVPLNCTAMALDPDDGKLYFEASGFLFVYGQG